MIAGSGKFTVVEYHDLTEAKNIIDKKGNDKPNM